jgi:PKD repeat protein
VKPTTRTWLVKGGLAAAFLVPLLLGVAGCWLFNVLPVASFTMSVQSGQAPLTVDFSAVLSRDEDGTIILFEWDFGDGDSGSGEDVTHTYDTAGTYVVVLRVTDDDEETATTRKTLYVLPGEPPGPVARFTASPTSGASPLSVSFDAGASTYDGGTIVQYEWNFGDGRFGYGRTLGHTYFSSGTSTFIVTLTIHGADGKTDTVTDAITVSAAGGVGPSGSPSARFDIDDNDGMAPHTIRCDPDDSEAVEGRVIATYSWSFGDGSATSTINSTVQTHTYTTDAASEVFSVTLVVIDDVGATGSMTKTVKATNYQPVAGFEINNMLGVNLNAKDNPPPDGAADVNWKHDDVLFTGVQTGTTTVWIRSLQIPDEWIGDPADDPLVPQKDKAGQEEPKAPDYIDNNYCYDPEGQGWDEAPGGYEKADKPSVLWKNAAWGIERIEIDWDDGTITENYDYYAYVMNESAGDAGLEDRFYHTYAMPGTSETYHITVTAHDFLGAQSSFTRDVTLNVGT